MTYDTTGGFEGLRGMAIVGTSWPRPGSQSGDNRMPDLVGPTSQLFWRCAIWMARRPVATAARLHQRACAGSESNLCSMMAVWQERIGTD